MDSREGQLFCLDVGRAVEMHFWSINPITNSRVLCGVFLDGSEGSVDLCDNVVNGV